MVGALDSKETKTLFKTTSRVQYAEPGYLLFVRERTLVAQRFDAGSPTVNGEPMPVGEGLGSGDLGLASFSVSRNGVLVFRAGELTGTRLVWLDRSGKETPVLDAPADYRDTALSPDGTRLAYDIADSANSRGDIWIRDLRANVSSRFTFDAAAELSPFWSPDGRRIVYTSRAKGPGDLYIKDASGTKEAEPLLVSPDEKYVSDWSRDGRYVLFHESWPRRQRLGHVRDADSTATRSRSRSATRSSTSCGRRCLPTASTSPTSRTSRAGPRSTCTSSPRRATSGRSR